MLLNVFLVWIIVWFLVWLANTVVPGPDEYKRVFNAIVLFILVIWTLRVLGVFEWLSRAVSGVAGAHL